MNPEQNSAQESHPEKAEIPDFLQPIVNLEISKEKLSQIIARLVLICPDEVIARGDERDQLPAPKMLILELRPDSSNVSANMYTLPGGKVKEKHFPGGSFAAENLEEAGRNAVVAKIQEELGINLREFFSDSGSAFSIDAVRAEGFFENSDEWKRTWTTLVYSLILPKRPPMLVAPELGGVVSVNEKVFLQKDFTEEEKKRWSLFLEELNYLAGHFPAVAAVLGRLLSEENQK